MSVDDTMIGARTVMLFSADAGWGGELVASLPRALRRFVSGPAEIALVDGTDADWIAALGRALDQGARTLAVCDPAPADPAAVLALADRAEACGAHIAPIFALADNPAVARLRGLLDGSFGELTLDAGGAATAAVQLLAQLRLLRALGVEMLHLAVLAGTAQAFVAEGGAGLDGIVRQLRLTGACDAAERRISLCAYGATATARLDWTGGAEARPVLVSLADEAGLRSLPAIHEGGLRHGLRRLLAAEAPADGAAMRALAADLTMLHELLGTN